MKNIDNIFSISTCLVQQGELYPSWRISWIEMSSFLLGSATKREEKITTGLEI